MLSDEPAWEVGAVLEVVDQLEPLDPAARDGWMVSDDWGGTDTTPWVLRYTSSRTFHRNEGLTGYACKRPDCKTPEVIMRVDSPRRDLLELEEPILRSGADSAMPGDSSVAECTWKAGPNDVLKLDALALRADGREWKPRDPNSGDEVDMDAEKAIRVVAMTVPVYLDGNLLLTRSALLPEVVFVWTRLGDSDPPVVELEEVEGMDGSDAAILAAALAARDSGPSSTPRPSRGNDVIPRYN